MCKLSAKSRAKLRQCKCTLSLTFVGKVGNNLTDKYMYRILDPLTHVLLTCTPCLLMLCEPVRQL